MSVSASDHWHRVCGLSVRSHFALPELPRLSRGGSSDVEIVESDVPDRLPGVRARGVQFEVSAEELLLRVEGVARYLASAGRRIAIARTSGAADDEVRLFLFGPVFGGLLQQRNELVLHGSAVVAAGRGIAFLGAAGAGKSTLAAAFRARGHAVLGDDHVVLRPGRGGGFAVEPALPWLKLWPDSLGWLGVAADQARSLRPGVRKRLLPLAADFATEPAPVKKIYVLAPSNRRAFAIERLAGARKFNVLRSHLYRPRFEPGENPGRFARLMTLAQQAEVAIVARPRADFSLDELWRRIDEDVRA